MFCCYAIRQCSGCRGIEAGDSASQDNDKLLNSTIQEAEKDNGDGRNGTAGTRSMGEQELEGSMQMNL